MTTTISDASHRKAPAAVLHRPRSAAQLQKLVQRAAARGSLLTVVGGRSGLTGGSVPLFGGDAIVMSQYLSVKPRPGYTNIPFKLPRGTGNYLLSSAEPRSGVFPAGITLAEMDALLAEHGLFYAPKPGYMGGQLGGAVATNASGPRTLAFGDTRANVRALQAVLPNGELIRLERTKPARRRAGFELSGTAGLLPFPAYPAMATKNASGFYSGTAMEPIDLFVGCEGTLGIFTEVDVALIERQAINTQLFFFESVEQAFGFVDALRRHTYNRSLPQGGGVLSLEFMDQNALSFVDGLLQTKRIDWHRVGAAVEVEAFAGSTETSELINDYAAKYQALAVPLKAEFIMKLRYSIPQGVNELMAERGFIKIASDFAVPSAAFAEMYAAYRAADAAMTKATGQAVGSATWGHIGNYHLHWNALPNSKAAAEQALELYTSLGRRAVALGGTLSAEHGTGKKQLIPGEPLLYTMDKARYNYAVSLIERVNPGYLLNRGNMIGYPPLS